MDKKNLCEQYKNKLSKYLDHEFPEEEHRLLKQHIRSCIGCAMELEQLRNIDHFGKAEVFQDPGKGFWIKQRGSIAAEIGGTVSRTVSNQHRIRFLHSTLFKSTKARIAISVCTAAALTLFITQEIYDVAIYPDTPQLLEQQFSENAGKPEDISDKSGQIAQDVEETASTEVVHNPEGDSENTTRQPHIVFHDADEHDNKTHIAADKPNSGTEVNLKAFDNLAVSSGMRSTSDASRVTTTPPSRDITISALQKVPLASGYSGGGAMMTQESVKLPHEDAISDDDFEIYLKYQNAIRQISDLSTQKSKWFVYLQTIQNVELIDLVVYEIYELYLSIVDQSSPHELKIETIDFLIHYRDALEGFLGTTQYKERLTHFSNLF